MVDRVEPPEGQEDRELMERLGRYVVKPTELDRDDLMFRAGAAAAQRDFAQREMRLTRSRRAWQAACITSSLVAMLAVAINMRFAPQRIDVVSQPVVPASDPLQRPGEETRESLSTDTGAPPELLETAPSIEAPPPTLAASVSRPRSLGAFLLPRTQSAHFYDRLAKEGLRALSEAPRYQLMDEVAQNPLTPPGVSRRLDVEDMPRQRIFPWSRADQENAL
jgi:hypothetical protein